MQTATVHLYEATDAQDSFALKLEGDQAVTWRAAKGYGRKYQQAWTVELQSERIPELNRVDWDAVLERVIEAYSLSDPLLANYTWPLRRRS